MLVYESIAVMILQCIKLLYIDAAYYTRENCS